MSEMLILFFLSVWLVAGIILIVKAFQVSVGWGLAALFLPLGWLIFLCKHWREGRVPFCVGLCSYVAAAVVAVNDPAFVQAFKKGFEARRRLAEARRSGGGAAPTRGPHEARDLAEGEAPAPTPPPGSSDPYAAQRAAYAKHSAELSARFQVLNAERIALKPGGNYATFNAKAAQYAQDIRALQAEGTALQALDHPGTVPTSPADAAAKPLHPTGQPVPANVAQAAPTSDQPPLNGTPAPLDGEASAALSRLRADTDQGDYAAFATELKKCFADYRQTRYFPQIVAYARQTLRSHPPESLTDTVRQSASLARAEMESTSKQVQTIVNQVPPVVVPPRNSTEVYHYAFHPGALKPDFNKSDIVSTRERWNGDYVYMDDKPGVFYRSADCEFNPQTKFFYTDRTVPKKKLTDVETQEVVRLYRILGRDERILESFGQRMASVDRASADLVALNRQLASASR